MYMTALPITSAEELRERFGITPEQLALDADVSVATVYRALTTKVTERSIRRINKVLAQEKSS